MAEDLFDDDIGFRPGRLPQPVEIGLGVGKTVDMVEPQTLDLTGADEIQNHAMAVFEDRLVLDAQADKAGRYAMENGNAGSRPHTPAPLQAECTELHDTIRVLLATLGHPLFEPLARISAKADDAGLFYCRASEADARGLFTEEGFVVLKGSTGRAETVPSFQKHGYQRVRDRLLEQGVLAEQNGRIRFERDHLFPSPSAAAACVTGRTANGLIEWKDARGRTLNEVRGTPSGTGELS